jgi:hypothetical protein
MSAVMQRSRTKEKTVGIEIDHTQEREMGDVISVENRDDFTILVYDNRLSPWAFNVQVWFQGDVVFERYGYYTAAKAVEAAYRTLSASNWQ